MRQRHGPDALGTGDRLGALLAFIASLGAVAMAVAASAASIYVAIAMATGDDVVPRTTHDLRILGSLSLVIACFAVVMATRDELRARRRAVSETPESLPGASAHVGSVEPYPTRAVEMTASSTYIAVGFGSTPSE